MARYHIGHAARPLALVTVSALAGAGCRTGTRPDADAGERVPTVFFPAAPDRPRIQSLSSFGGAADVEAKKGGFHAFVMGKDATGKDAVEIGHPHGVAVRDGGVCVCDTSSNRIARLSFRETSYSTFGPAGVGKLRKPGSIAVGGPGHEFVADTLRQQVVVFGPDDAYVSAFALPDGSRPVDIAGFQKSINARFAVDYLPVVTSQAAR
jgi:hypothetical protein